MSLIVLIMYWEDDMFTFCEMVADSCWNNQMIFIVLNLNSSVWMRAIEAWMTRCRYLTEVSVVQRLWFALDVVFNQYKTLCSDLLSIEQEWLSASLCKRLSSCLNLIWLEWDDWSQLSWWCCDASRYHSHEPYTMNCNTEGCKDDSADCEFNLSDNLQSQSTSGPL